MITKKPEHLCLQEPGKGEIGIEITCFRSLSAQFVAHKGDGGASGQFARLACREYGKQACHDRRLLIELADAVEDGSPLLAVSAVNQMADDALLVNHDSQRESLPLYP